MKYFSYDTVTSTNDAAKEICGKYRRAAVLARAQTKGRGRCGRSFYSPEGAGLYMSYILDVTPDEALKIPLTPLCAVAVCRALEAFGVRGVGIKWVNDVYLRGKKVCGILVESCGDKVICGIGVNLTTESFPEGLGNAGSVSLAIPPKKLAKRIVRNIDRALKRRDFKEEYVSRSVLTGKTVEFSENGVMKKALVTGFDGDLRLLVSSEGKTRALSSGEVHITEIIQN
ncbi:MAG: biotin--[Clostridia bacterium]|nr:biotin--[acetyl-CoA-carboxylase] ligase [Clostridia bacterium]